MKTSFPLTVMLFALASGSRAHAGDSDTGLPFGLDPAHSHLLTNHIPIFVTLSGLIALALAMLWKNDVARRVALVLLLIGAAGGLVTYWFGHEAYMVVRGLADDRGAVWLDLHMERAEKFIWILWLAAISAAAALAMVWRRMRLAPAATLLATALGAATLGISGWIADAGGKVRHPEIRGEQEPASAENSFDDPKASGTAPHEH
jgi:hypothetical protein